MLESVQPRRRSVAKRREQPGPLLAACVDTNSGWQGARHSGPARVQFGQQSALRRGGGLCRVWAEHKRLLLLLRARSSGLPSRFPVSRSAAQGTAWLQELCRQRWLTRVAAASVGDTHLSHCAASLAGHGMLGELAAREAGKGIMAFLKHNELLKRRQLEELSQVGGELWVWVVKGGW